ncbi:SusC/RagA family TonB-linked outer membrane protein [Rhodocytophaga rosea]|uniref:SusC/RagA family TonB-linked outer membrane protein n=1 Tax=Rhodocytophaga rosea TaxID=2704465 RepID=A0A6C0GC79_9BACT|nr:SusC/RagA family TonB-linked outer membrane protein [Rhodocytophaga rosea]QHT65589.1 SusC/RagA family TonB-linked outer membrane protein [Rhodocytophaga rosea]
MKNILLIVFLLSGIGIYAQDGTITGKVKDAKGELLPGVNVFFKNTTSGTVTDAEGNYAIKTVPGNNILIFSFVGFKTQEVTINNRSAIDISLLSDDQLLEEVVVTAVGIESKTKALGYSVAEVKGKDIVNAREPNVVQALSGKVAGVQIGNSGGSPGGSASIRIRGNSSLLGNNSPLFIVDGIPVDNSIQDILGNITNVNSLATPSNRAVDINSDDIESVTVLKGPAAAALYGIRAANGAVILTTKRGTRLTDKSFNVSYSGSFTVDEINRRVQPQQNNFSNGLNGQYILPGQTGSDESWGALLDTLTYSDIPSQFDKNGLIVGQNDPRSNGIPVNRYDNVDNFYLKGKTQSHHVSVYGNTEKAGYYFSVGRLYQTGVIPTTDFFRTTFRFNGDYNVTDKFKIAGGINFINSGANNRALMGGFNTNVVRALMNTSPNFDITNGLDEPWNNPNAYRLPATNAKPWGDSRSYANGRGWDSPYWSLNMNPQNDEVNRFISFTEANYEILPWLKSTFRYGIDSYTDVRKGGFSRGTSGVPTGTINDVNYTRRDYNTDLIFTIAPELGGDLNLTVLLGHNFYNSFRNQINTRGDGLIVPGNFNISNASTSTSFNQTIRRRLVAGYADVRLDYRNWLFVELTGRNEWTSTLAKGKNSFFYPSINTSWVFTDALGLSSGWLSSGKVRATYAQVGNDADPYSLQTYYTNSNTTGWIQGGVTYPFNNQAGLSYSNTLGNPNLKPERISTWELGTDLRFLNNRAGIEAVYYHNLSKDQIIPVAIPSSTGSQFSLINAGEISNRGVEITLNATPIQTPGSFRWDATLVYSKNISKVLSLAEGIDNVSLGGIWMEARGMVGQPYGVFYGIDVKKNEEGKVLIDDSPVLANGTPNSNYGYPIVNPSFTQIGDPNPKFNAGLRNEFTYKNFAFSFFLDTRYGFDIFNAPHLQMVFNGVDKSTENRGQDHVFDGVKNGEGTANDINVKIGQAWYRRTFDIQGLYIEKNLYWLRLRDVNFTYSLPEKLIAPLKLTKASLTLTARNFLLSTNYTGSDPDLGTRNGLTNFSGIDFWTTPNTRSYGASINLTF